MIASLLAAVQLQAAHYIYDANNQLISVAFDGETQAVYGYDAAGNITSIARRGVVDKGSFHGLVTAADPALNGSVTVTFNKRGGFTATFVLGGARYAMSGEFSPTGVFTGQLKRGKLPPLDVTLTLDVAAGADRITGKLSQGGVDVADIAADQALFNLAVNPAPEAGSYTVVLPPDPAHTDATLFPQGFGFGTVNVTVSGAVKFIGTLADGTKVSLGTYLAQDRAWPLYLAPYRKAGIVSGMVKFRDVPDVSDLDALLDWSRPANANAVSFKAGFDTTTSLVGSRYERPAKGERIIALAATSPNLLAHFEAGGLPPAGQDVLATLSDANKVTAAPGETFSLSISTASGLFAGRFLDATANRLRNFGGAFLQKQSAGAGFFLGEPGTGSIELNAP